LQLINENYVAVMTIAMDFRKLETFLLLSIIFVACILPCNCVPNSGGLKDSSTRNKSEKKDSVSENYERFTAPQLSRDDKRYLAKIEDALTSKKGKLIYTNSWAVQLKPEEVASADQIAKRNGFHNVGQIGNLENYYHFKHRATRKRSRRSATSRTESLMEDEHVIWAEQQHLLDRRRKDGIPTDPKFNLQWYLRNTGQSTGPAGVDLNVLPAWQQGFNGKGVVVSVLDDGVDHNHPDLRDNYDQKASYDFNDMDADPKPRDSDPDNCHGTRCAGEIAAVANNSVCGVGVAYAASIGGVRMLDGQATDILEGSSLSFQSDYIDIYSNCWGPKDDGKTFGKPGKLAQEALMQGALKGRDGKGNIYVWATGNGGLTDDDCNCDGYTTSIYTISIGCISDHGLSAYYTELCSSTLAVTFNGGSHREKEENKIITTDLKNKCTEEFKGTSSAAPLAAGAIALVLQANSKLTWRDVQHIIVNAAQVTSPVDEGWVNNGAGFHFNHKFGFGRLDASKMVSLAKNWKNVARQRKCLGPSSSSPQEIPAGGTLSITIDTIACEGTDYEITKLEHVTLTVSFQHRRRGDVSIDLFSPMGTRNEMLSTRRYDDSDKGLHDWTFMTVHCWGENPKGVWTLNVTDNIPALIQKGLNINGYLQHDTSKQEPDVEDLEEEVIDEEEELKAMQAKKKGRKPPKGPAKYPQGVRRNQVRLIDPDLIANDLEEDKRLLLSDDAIADMFKGNDRRTVVTGGKDDELIFNKMQMYDKNPDLLGFEKLTGLSDSPELRSFGTDDSQSSEVFGYDRNIENIESNIRQDNVKRMGLSYQDPRVQVQQEETGSQRVQVSNGYQEPYLPVLNPSTNRVSSGQFLEWSLTFYGTGPEED